MKFVLFIAVAVIGCSAAADLHRPEENIGIKDPALFEGDMYLTPAQRHAAMTGGDVSKAGLGRASISGGLWPNGIVPYTIDREFEKENRAMEVLGEAMWLWESKTCIKFKKRTNEPNYIHVHMGRGCTSRVGVYGGRQYLSLSSSGCWFKHTAVHEIGHALGFYHEQSRPDRDDYVTIHWDNIHDDYKFAFNKYTSFTINSLGTPYDYASIMHYEEYAFSKNKEKTITPTKQGVKLGNREGPSEIDARQMNLLYKCSGGGGGGGGNCQDMNHFCAEFAGKGDCENHPLSMGYYCKKSCGKCW